MPALTIAPEQLRDVALTATATGLDPDATVVFRVVADPSGEEEVVLFERMAAAGEHGAVSVSATDTAEWPKGQAAVRLYSDADPAELLAVATLLVL